MNEDVLDLVLGYSANYVDALSSNPDILKHIIGCDICNSLMLEPYTLQCGHSFCGKCLESWTQERAKSSTCPTCRAPIKSTPVLSLGLRQLALAVVASWNKNSQHKEKVAPELLEQSETPSFFPNGAFEVPRYDSEDEVYRCPLCDHEIEEDGVCSGCSVHFDIPDASRDLWNTDTDYGESEEDDFYIRRRSRRNNGNSSLLGARNLRSLSARSGEDEGDEIEDDDDDDNEADGIDVDEDDEGDLDSFIDDDEDDDSVIDTSMRSRRSAVVLDDDDDDDEDRDDEEDEDKSGSEDSDADMDQSEIGEAEDTSDDSLLEETRNRQSDLGDIEITSVRHRPVVIDDDDDDED